MLPEELRKARRRVVITGCGAVTPLALTAEETWAALLEGRSGIRTITGFDASDLPTSIAGEVRGFDPSAYVPHRVSRRMDSYAQYAVGAAVQALESSGLRLDSGTADRTGVLVGSGYGPVQTNHSMVLTLRDKGPRFITPYSQVTGAMDSAAGEISMLTGARGPSRALSTACASGTDAIGEAAQWIRYGLADAAITGGAEDCITRVDIAGSGNAKALSVRVDEPQKASRPFDTDRDGFVMSAGAGIVVLEEAEAAVRRGAPILAELIGYGASSDAYHWTAPRKGGEGMKQAMRAAIDDAGIEPEEIGYVNAHGTSTPLNDEVETAAIRDVLGPHATTIPVSSTKSMTGHMIGAAGAVELIASVHVLGTGMVPPTINCENPLDKEMNYVAHVPQRRDVEVAMSNSFGFGGHNAVLLIRRWQE
ncbi:beta-ketoacyl-ACP synthase II [Streptomyces sp. NBC_01142]|uniref:beta-ketoacyl-ACP synthase II n=1 Tax=Streptomyces sp. NBC_01142 TaxID=2975865 RepID=UPI002258E631|nr:beta-ketoacyl-ACP synthase II [Streptomyces sp. NBC_01142]MCX4824588.1 beta-ketoacyl-ACP synthase II [Streptomyces sp. NBC_01142]